MKRHRDLIQLILEYVECKGNGHSLSDPTPDEYCEKDVRYHIRLCKEAGFVHTSGTKRPALVSLTWAGHEELDRMRGEA